MPHTCIGVLDIGPKFLNGTPPPASEKGWPVAPAFIATYAQKQSPSIVDLAMAVGFIIVPADASMTCFLVYPSLPVPHFMIAEGPDPCAHSLYHQKVQNTYHCLPQTAIHLVSGMAHSMYAILGCTSVYIIINHLNTVFIPSTTYVVDLAERTDTHSDLIARLKNHVIATYPRLPWTEGIDPFPTIPD